MTEPSGPPASTDKPGVVEPLRIPIPASVAGWWARLPITGRIFAGLAALDVIGRALGVLGPQLVIDPGQPLFLLAELLPRELVILLPALILTRRPDADAATPLVLRGAIVIALAELISPQLSGYTGGIGTGTLLSWAVVTLVTVVIRAGAWITIAIGLLTLSEQQPSRTVAGLANVASGGLAGMAIVQLLLALQRPPVDLVAEDWNTLLQLTSAFALLESFALAFLARVVIRGADDSRRPLVATRLAVTAFAVIGAIAVIDLALVVATLFRTTFALGFIPAFGPGLTAGPGAASLAFGWFGSNLMTSAYLVAFALGLADTSVRIPGPGSMPEPEPEDDHPAWPEPGGDVPVWPQRD